jgi:DNA-binding response OmpR family regulator
MLGSAPKATRYRFGPFELNTAEESLARNGTRVKVQDLPYRLLVMLLERPGGIVTRELEKKSGSACGRKTRSLSSIIAWA